MQQEQAFASVLASLVACPAPAPISRVTAAALGFIDCSNYSAAFDTLQACAVRSAKGNHAVTIFYLIDSALKQSSRLPEAEAVKNAVAKHFGALWNAVSPLLQSSDLAKIDRLLATWERTGLVTISSLPRPPPPPQPMAETESPPAPAIAKPSPVVAVKPPAAATAFKPHAPHHPHHPYHPHAHPHGNHSDDDDGIEPFAGAGGNTGVWNAQYVACIDTEHEFGDKIVLPASALSELTTRAVKFPILLQLRNPANNKRTYAGVREFSAPEGKCMLPRWVLNNVEGTELRRLHIRTVDLPLCTFAKLRPVSENFARVTDPKALLEALLRYFSALTVNHALHLHGQHSYDFLVTELQPADAVCIIDTTMEVEFEGIEQQAEATVAAPAAAAVAKEQTGWRQGSGDSWARDNPSVVVKSCGNCGSKVPQDKWALHEAVCYRQNFGCPKCGKKMKIADKAAHLAEEHAPVQCPSCNSALEQYQLEMHKSAKCPARMLTCRYCTLYFQARAMPEHEGYCGSRTEVCELCGKRITLAGAERHVNTECIAVMDRTDAQAD